LSDPTKYVPGYSYSGWQANNPSKPLPAGQVDNDFAKIKITTDQTIDALADIRRSDGDLNNGIVTIDSLAPDVLGLFSDAASGADVPIYATAVGLSVTTVPEGVNAIRTNGYYAAGDGGGALYRLKNVSEADEPGQQYSDGGTKRWALEELVPNVFMFGAKADGVTNDVAAFQAGLDYVRSNKGTLVVPAIPWSSSNTIKYFLSGKINVWDNCNLVGDSGNGSVGSCLWQDDVTQSLLVVYSGARIDSLIIRCNNTNNVTPIVAPPTIVTCPGFSSYPRFTNLRFQHAYIAIGAAINLGVDNSAIFVENIRGFVHHRMVYLGSTLDVSYIQQLHSQNPDGLSWNSSWYSYNNKVLVESEGADGILGDNWFSFAGKGLFKLSGTGNLNVVLNNITGEALTEAINIAPGAAQAQGIQITGGYIQPNLRTDTNFMISNAGTATRLVVSNMWIGTAVGKQTVITDGTGETTLTGCVMQGSSGAIALYKNSVSSKLLADGCTIRSFSKVLDWAAGCDNNITITRNNMIDTGAGVFMSATPTGLVDINEPSQYIVNSVQQTVVRSRTPSHDQRFDVSDNFMVHRNSGGGVAEGGALVSSATNSNGAAVSGAKAKLVVRNTNATPGAEDGYARIYAYTAGAYGTPFEIRGDGRLLIMSLAFVGAGSGSPEGVITAPIGSIWMRSDGTAGTTLYKKTSGTGNTGWTAS
jgi:hypothetical protein